MKRITTAAEASTASVEDVVGILEEIDMGQYAPLFRARRIDGPAFLDLEPDDLKDMGIDSARDRFFILNRALQIISPAYREIKG